MTHEDLCVLAVRWLTDVKRCTAVLSEMHSFAEEIPDAIGFKPDCSIVVECKVSRDDLFRNTRKRQMSHPVGNRLYFLTPMALFLAEEIPNGYGWLTTNGREIVLEREAPLVESPNLDKERTMLLSILRRVKTKSYLTLVDEREASTWTDSASPVCPRCGEPLDNGEGWDGLCGNCADAKEVPDGDDDTFSVTEAGRAALEDAEQIDDLRAALQKISDWANRAYSEQFFEGPVYETEDMKTIEHVLAGAGFSMGALHALWGRHLFAGIGKIAREALGEAEPRKEETK